MAGPLKSEPVVSSAVFATSSHLLLPTTLFFLYYIRLQVPNLILVLVLFGSLSLPLSERKPYFNKTDQYQYQWKSVQFVLPRTSKAPEEYQCDEPRDIGHRCDNCKKSTKARLSLVYSETILRLIRWDNIYDWSVETILRLICWDNFYDATNDYKWKQPRNGKNALSNSTWYWLNVYIVKSPLSK